MSHHEAIVLVVQMLRDPTVRSELQQLVLAPTPARPIKVWTVQEAAERFGVTERHFRRLVADHYLWEAFGSGRDERGGYLFDAVALWRWRQDGT